MFQHFETLFCCYSVPGACLCVFLGICLIDSQVLPLLLCALFFVCYLSVFCDAAVVVQSTYCHCCHLAALSANPLVTQTGSSQKAAKHHQPAKPSVRLCAYCMFLNYSALVLCVSHLVTILRCDFHQVITPKKCQDKDKTICCMDFLSGCGSALSENPASKHIQGAYKQWKEKGNTAKGAAWQTFSGQQWTQNYVVSQHCSKTHFTIALKWSLLKCLDVTNPQKTSVSNKRKSYRSWVCYTKQYRSIKKC